MNYTGTYTHQIVKTEMVLLIYGIIHPKGITIC